MPSPLEMPPPPPAQVGAPGPPGLAQMAGGQGGGQQDQSIQLVTQHLMEAEQALQAAVRIKPELAAIVEKFTNEVKPQAGQILFGNGQQPGASDSGSQAPVGTALMASGMGAQNQQP